jgi:adenylate cyclase
MGVEIERKFLVHKGRLPPLGAPKRLEQGYVSHDPVVRVRLVAEAGNDLAHEAWLTIKGKGTLSRAEFEYAIPPSDAREILAMCARPIQKNRYLVQHGAHTWEVDEFFGALDGLWVAEIELDREDEAFESPPWIARDVTDDARYTNSALARHGLPPRE